MFEFEEERPFIWRLKVPFEKITTSVFLIQTELGWLLFDCASNAADVMSFIFPALKRKQVNPDEIHWLFCSHSHIDHAGGMECVLRLLPTVKLVENGALPNCLVVLDLPGHAQDCRAIMDLRTRTLLSGDGLQFCGVDRFGCALSSPAAYRRSISLIRKWEPECILASHDYVPFGSRADTEKDVLMWLDYCENYVNKAMEHTKYYVYAGIEDAKCIAKHFWAKHPVLPPLHEATIQAILREEHGKG